MINDVPAHFTQAHRKDTYLFIDAPRSSRTGVCRRGNEKRVCESRSCLDM